MSVPLQRYGAGQAFEVEFVTAEGTTVAVLTLAPTDIRPISGVEAEGTEAAWP